MSVSLEELKEKCLQFEELERRSSFYDLATNLVDKGFEIEAFLLILSTWNSAIFRYVVNRFDISSFKQTIEEKCNPIFEKLKDKDIQSVNLDEIKEDVESLYNILSEIDGVKYTGASKILHLKIPRLFIMWDSYIKKYYKFEKGTANDYFNFLKKMQETFKDVEWKQEDKTLAKAIDEYNYVTITIPEREKKKNK